MPDIRRSSAYTVLPATFCGASSLGRRRPTTRRASGGSAGGPSSAAMADLPSGASAARPRALTHTCIPIARRRTDGPRGRVRGGLLVDERVGDQLDEVARLQRALLAERRSGAARGRTALIFSPPSASSKKAWPPPAPQQKLSVRERGISTRSTASASRIR